MITGNKTVVNVNTGSMAWAGYTRVSAMMQQAQVMPRKLLSSGAVRPMMGSDDYLPGILMLDLLFDTEEVLPEPLPPSTISHTGGLILTFQKQDEDNNAATLAGSGFVSARGFPELLNDRLAIARIAFQFDGYSGPNYSKEEAPP